MNLALSFESQLIKLSGDQSENKKVNKFVNKKKG